MTTHTGSGSIPIAALDIIGYGSVLEAAPGPNTRQSDIIIDMDFSGTYFDDLDLQKNDVFTWKAEGLRYPIRNGIGEGQANRFWYKRDMKVEYGQSIDLDLYSFLTVDGGKGFGQDQLGLSLIMNEIVLIYIKNKRFGSTLLVGDSSVAPWEPLFNGVARLPHGCRMIAQTKADPGWPVTQGISQYLRLSASGTACTLDIFVAGRYVPAS